MRGKVVAITGCLLGLIQGCAPIPKQELAMLSSSCACEKVVQGVLLQEDFILGDWPKEKWWEDFDDPTLTSLIQFALELAPTLKRAEERFKAAMQVALQKRGALFPEIDLQADNNWQHLARDGFFRAFAPVIPAVVNDVNLHFSLSYEFDFWGKYRSLFEAALGLSKALFAEKKQAELMLTTSIAYIYVEMQFLLCKQQILQKMQSNQMEAVATHKQRRERALEGELGVLRSESSLLDIQNTLLEVEELIRKHMHRLKALSALGQDAEFNISFHSFWLKEIVLPKQLSLNLIARRPDLAAQKARVESMTKEIHAAKTDFYPNINLLALIGFETVHWPTLFQKKNYSASIDPALHLPIFTAGRLKAQLKEKIAQFNEAVFAYNELILDVAKDVADRLTTLFLLEKQIGVRRLSLQTAEKEKQLIQSRFEQALSDQLEVLAAKNNVLQKRLFLAEAEYSKQLAGVLLIRDLGGGYHE